MAMLTEEDKKRQAAGLPGFTSPQDAQQAIAGMQAMARAQMAASMPPAPAAAVTPAPMPQSQALAAKLSALPEATTQRDLAQRNMLEQGIRRAEANERYDAAGPQAAADARAAAFQRMTRSVNRPLSAPARPVDNTGPLLAAHDAANPSLAPSVGPSIGTQSGPQPDVAVTATNTPSSAVGSNPPQSTGLPGYDYSPGPANMPPASADSPNLSGLSGFRTNGGDVQKTVDANGRTTYSGTNISGPITINGKEAGGGYMEVPGGRGVGGLPGYAGAPSGLAGVVGGAGVRTGIGDFQSADAAIMAANLRDGVDVNRGTSWGGGPKMQVIGGAPMGFNRDPRIVADEAGTNARVAQAMGTDAASIQRRHDLGLAGIRNAAEMASINQRAAESQARLGLDMRRLQGDEQTAALDREKTGLGITAIREEAQLRAQMADPNATEAQRKIARDALLARQGKSHTDRYTVVRGGQAVDEMGRPYNRPDSVLDNQSGQWVTQPSQGTQALPAGMRKQVGTSQGKPVYEDEKGNRFVGA